MPELPEIETVRLQLTKVLPGRRVEWVKVLNSKIVEGDLKKIVGLKVEDIRRRAKVLLIDLEKDLTLAFHFKMTGQLVLDYDDQGKTYKDRIVGGHPTEDFVGTLPSAHTRVIFKLDQGTLYFNDQRLFGWVRVGTKASIANEKFLQKLGPEPFEMATEEFAERVSKSRRPIKLVLMDQEVISGLGNIYANDALWEAKINPQTPSNKLTDKQLKLLFSKVKLVLEEGIKYGGATAADAKYIDLRGLGGHYQDHFRVYDQTGLPCHRCKTRIKKDYMSGRGTYYCPKCQS
ncbi:MAG: bifunctional DNA-formamidopyrimidine glycosylase/DNA-(apurinic or apyrimidinic site) lyase [bacterium]|nr:bifunctional DNA-formamidopyrimidine glycosylase/DNA-(apurinic or apyrimidinic site) lyase [bacterium]